jgi:hypothetical protein
VEGVSDEAIDEAEQTLQVGLMLFMSSLGEYRSDLLVHGGAVVGRSADNVVVVVVSAVRSHAVHVVPW